MENGLKSRASRERSATDETRLYENVRIIHNLFDHVYNCPVVEHAKEWRRQILTACIPGATVLDYGCHYGPEIESYLNLKPDILWGVDISSKAINFCKNKFGDKARFVHGDGQNMTFFEDEYFDVIVGNAILHHLDFKIAVKEIHRVLKLGGIAIFLEPLRDNPAGKLYRILTPFARTRDEEPISQNQIEWADTYFQFSDHYFFSLLSAPVAMATSLIPGLGANNWVLRLCASFDEQWQDTELKYWMRACYLHWIK